MPLRAAVEIAWARRGDEARLTPLLAQLYLHEAPDAPEPTAETVAAHLDLLMSPETPHKLAIAWTQDRAAIGLAAVAYLVSVSDPRPERWRQMELKELFVSPDQRGAGVGAALMAWIEAEAVSASAFRIDWHVKADNARGVAFYRRIGAAVVQDRLSMRKALSPRG